MNNNVEEVKSRLNIVDVVGEYVRLTKAGTHWKGLCPFHHEKSPSFMVNEEKQIYHCFGCGKGGDVISFVMEIESLEFREVLKILAEKAGVQLEEFQNQKTDDKKRILNALELATKFYETQLWKGSGKEKILKYLYDRGLNDENIQKFRLGYAPNGWRNMQDFLIGRGFTLEEINKTGLLVKKAESLQLTADSSYDRFRDRIMFPIMDILGNVIGYSARVAPGGDESQAKYINTPETGVYHKSKALYGIFHAKQDIKRKNSVLLVEGNMDVIAAHQAGITNTVAVSGTALTQEQVIILKRYCDNIYMLFDMDSAGQQAAQKSVDLCLNNEIQVRMVTLEGGKDAAEVAQKDPELLHAALKNSRVAMEYIFESIVKKYDRTSAQGKQQIAKEVLAHVAHMTSQIEKAHWVKKIAHELDVEENIIVDVLKAATPKAYGREAGEQSSGDVSQASFQKRSDIIRDLLVGLILSDPHVWQEVAEQALQEPWAQDAKIRFVLQKGKEMGYSFDALVACIEDDRAKERLRKLYFSAKYQFTQEGVVEYSGDDLRQLIEGYIDQYSKELQKERLHSIIKDIQSAEQSGDREALNKLMSEFTELSQEIS